MSELWGDSEQQTDSIFGLIEDLNDSIGSQMAVIVIDTLKGQQQMTIQSSKPRN